MTDDVATGQDDWPGVLVIQLPSDLSRDRAPVLRQFLEPAFSGAALQIALDMSAVVDLGDASLSTLIRALKHAREAGGDVRLFATPRSAAKFLDAMGLDGVFQRFASEEEAVRSFAE